VPDPARGTLSMLRQFPEAPGGRSRGRRIGLLGTKRLLTTGRVIVRDRTSLGRFACVTRLYGRPKIRKPERAELPKLLVQSPLPRLQEAVLDFELDEHPFQLPLALQFRSKPVLFEKTNKVLLRVFSF